MSAPIAPRVVVEIAVDLALIALRRLTDWIGDLTGRYTYN